jgi:hypothetical protein
MNATSIQGSVQYESPELVELGTLHELTLTCDKRLGGSDGFTFMGQAIVCSDIATTSV